MEAVPRPRWQAAIEAALARSPVCALLGPRQSGKTTLAGQVAAGHPGTTWFDLESGAGKRALSEPEITLSPLRGLVVIDEVQVLPSLFTTLRPLADRRGTPARFLILGSASPTVVRGVSESLAGRVAFVDLTGLDLRETGPGRWRDLWVRGGFPPSFLAKSDENSLEWRRDFLRTFVERDLPALDVRSEPELLRRFWMLVAHYHGQAWNAAALARNLGVRVETVRRYVDLMVGTFLLRRLSPWHENIAKRQVRSPKVYVRDSGLLHLLLSVGGWRDLIEHPRRGASWEGFAMEQVLALANDADAHFWGVHGSGELDLLLSRGGKRYGFEFKYADAPGMPRSLHTALGDLGLERAWIVHPGEERYPLHAKVEAVPLAGLVAGGALPLGK